MRLWSVHPKYMDARGLVAVWREGLLAKKVLQGKTNGYTHHPQLCRFRESGAPLVLINLFLTEIYRESLARDYTFDKMKLAAFSPEFDGEIKIPVASNQVIYEFRLLQTKLRERNPEKYRENRTVERIEINGVFTAVEGDIEPWEKVKDVSAEFSVPAVRVL